MKTILQRLLNKSVGERDVGAIEVHHILDSLPLFDCNRQFVYLSVDGAREVKKVEEMNPQTGQAQSKVKVCDSSEDRYKKRSPDLEHEDFFEYCSTRTPTGKRRDPALAMVPVIKPYAPFSPAPEPDQPPCTKHEKYCKVKLLVHIPWRLRPEECPCQANGWCTGCKCVLKGAKTYAEAFKKYLAEGMIPRVVQREIHRKRQEDWDAAKAKEAEEMDKELFGVDAKKKSKLDSMAYMDEAVDEDNRLQGLRNPELDDWLVQLRGTIPDLEDPPLRNYNAETDWNAMGTDPAIARTIDEHLYPSQGENDWVRSQKDLNEVDETWTGYEDIDFAALNSDPMQQQQKAAVCLVVQDLEARVQQHETAHATHDPRPNRGTRARSQVKKPLRLIIRGTAGTGKSYVIRCIKKASVRRLGLEQAKKRIVFVAPTGCAAFNIRGQTLHHLLKLPIGKPFSDLQSAAAIKALEDAVGDVWLIILDERSMVGAKALSYIDSRLRKATGRTDLMFGGISIVMVGDDGQLGPIGDRPMWLDEDNLPFKDKDRHDREGNKLFSYFTTCISLRTAFRQNADDPFYNMLLETREGRLLECEQNTGLLATRKWSNVPKEEQDLFMSDALYLSPFRDSVWEHNIRELDSLGEPIVKAMAINNNKTAAAADNDTAGLPKVVWVAKKSRVMLTMNLWTKAGLVNGTMGEVVGFHSCEGDENERAGSSIKAILVRFPEYTGPRFPGFPDTPEWERVLPITRCEVPFQRGGTIATPL